MVLCLSRRLDLGGRYARRGTGALPVLSSPRGDGERRTTVKARILDLFGLILMAGCLGSAATKLDWEGALLFALGTFVFAHDVRHRAPRGEGGTR
jgi:hypothetical protein